MHACMYACVHACSPLLELKLLYAEPALDLGLELTRLDVLAMAHLRVVS